MSTTITTPDPGCEATTRHGDENAYVNHRCRCAVARRAMRRARLLRALHGDAPRVPIAGTQRRIRALVVAGWTLSELARRLQGTSQAATLLHIANGRGPRNRQMTTVRRGTAERIAALYDEIHADEPPAPPARTLWRVEQFREQARRWRWVGPERWTDDTIDNPEARCQPRRPDGAPTKRDVDEVLVGRLVGRWGITPSEQQVPRFPTHAEITAATEWNAAHGIGRNEGVRRMHAALCTLDPSRDWSATKRVYDRHAYEVPPVNATTAA